MLFNHIDCHQMKQNVDVNLLHNNKIKSQSQKSQKNVIKRQLFKQIDNYQQSSHQRQQNQYGQQKQIIKKSAYIVDSDNQEGQQSNYKNGFTSNRSHKSIDQVSQIIQNLSKEASLSATPKTQSKHQIESCIQHHLPIFSYNFCLQCSKFLICSSCIELSHSEHMILSFKSDSQAKQLTKQFLIQKIEQTLQKLKSKENDIKNKTYELQIIMKNTKKMQSQVIQKLENTFVQLQQLIRGIYEKEQKIYENKIQKFYQQFNQTGDQLREELLTIIQESFDTKTFDSRRIQKQPPAVPHPDIDRFKFSLEKTKKFYKSISQSLDEIKLKSSEFSKLLINKNPKQIFSSRNKKASLQKYEKFLTDNCYGNDNGHESKTSLIRILDTLSSP